MAFNYMQMSQKALDDELLDRILFAALGYAFTVQAEAGGTAGHAQRLALAKAISSVPEAWRKRFGVATISRMGALTAPITDANLDTAVAAIWNTVAGV